MSASQDEQRVDQRIRFDQSSIQVDAEGHELCRSGFRLRLDLRQPLPRVQKRKKPGNRDLDVYAC